MATLPKIKYKGKDINETRVLTFKYEGVEAFTAKYIAEKKDLNVICYHKHQGTAGQSTANGCYTTKENYGGYCRGYTYTTSEPTGQCRCGSGLPCKNTLCPYSNYYGGGTGYEGAEYTTVTRTGKHTSASGCNEWTYYVRYILGCGYDAE